MEVQQSARAYDMYLETISRAEKMLMETSGVEMSATSQMKMPVHHGSLLTKQELTQIWGTSCKTIKRDAIKCQPSGFRTIDGTCNNVDFPMFGAQGTPLARLLPPFYENGVDVPRGRNQCLYGNSFTPPVPSARHVSLSLLPSKATTRPQFTDLLWMWGQFIDHDFTFTPPLQKHCSDCEFTSACEPIQISPTDPAFGAFTQNRGQCMKYLRSAPLCSDSFGRGQAREQINMLTSFIDGSVVYGSTERVARALRSFSGGCLKVSPPFPGKKSTLPLMTPETVDLMECYGGRSDCFLCGDTRCNVHTGLLIMHTLFVREHNHCATNIALLNEGANDEQIYQICRKIIGAMIQKITYRDWLPKILGRYGFAKYVGHYEGYKSKVNPSLTNEFSTAAFRFGHSMVRPVMDRLDSKFCPLSIGPLRMEYSFFNPPQYYKSLGTDPIMRGMLTYATWKVDRFIDLALTTKLFQTPSNPGYDLAALDIQRGRDHGLEPYIQYARYCRNKFNLSPKILSYNAKLLMKAYGTWDTIDLIIGGLYELPVSDGFLGPTFSCIAGQGFKNIRDGDRFYFENPGVFTTAQFKSIQEYTLSQFLCDNMDNLTMVQNDAFAMRRRQMSCDSYSSFDYKPFKVEVDPKFGSVKTPHRELNHEEDEEFEEDIYETEIDEYADVLKSASLEKAISFKFGKPAQEDFDDSHTENSD